ncbi:MAG: c-type cytochrome domain-containing protein [Verrucomicrobiales bacterium]
MTGSPAAPEPSAAAEAGKRSGRGPVLVTVAAGFIALSVLLLPIVWAGPSAEPLNPWLEFIGTLHPVALHLPIGIILLVFTLEIAGWLSRGRYRPDTTVPLALGLAGAAVAAFLGYSLYMTGDYGRADLSKGIGKHLWGSIAFVCLTAGALIAKVWAQHKGVRCRVFQATLGLSVVALSLGAHEGGVITHGHDPMDDFIALLKGDSNPPPALVDPSVNGGKPTAMERLAYEEVVVPILYKYCYECHANAPLNPSGKSKVKGKLDLTTIDNLLKGGSSDLPSITPGNVADSYLIETMQLPVDDDEHMPPEDKDQPTAEEEALLVWWVEKGAPTGKSVGEIGGADQWAAAIDALPMPPSAAPAP